MRYIWIFNKIDFDIQTLKLERQLENSISIEGIISLKRLDYKKQILELV
jgi:hypothetical protein